jgi:peptidyl-prolyl cis-trans isomerase SurA
MKKHCLFFIVRVTMLGVVACVIPITNIFASGVGASVPASALQIKTVDTIVAYVNKQVITSSELDRHVAQVIAQYKDGNHPLPNLQDLKRSVLNQLIMQDIMLDLAARNGIKASDTDINNAIATIAQMQHISVDALEAKAKAQGLTYAEFRQQVANTIILQQLKERALYSRVTVSDEEVKRVLESEAYKNKVDYDLSAILIAIPNGATETIVNQKMTQAQDALKMLNSGASFSTVAVKYSNAPNAAEGGEIGQRSSLTLPPALNDALKDLKAGQYTPTIIKMPGMLAIFKVNSIKKYGMPQVVKQYHVRQILVKVGENMSDNEAHQKILMIRGLLMKDSGDLSKQNKDFIKLAKKYSDDVSSISGGDMGWISNGDTVPQFQSVVTSIKPNTISEPIRSPFGWHILEVIGMKDSDLMTDKEKAAVKNDIRQSKMAVAEDNWQREIRQAAYVKITNE